MRITLYMLRPGTPADDTVLRSGGYSELALVPAPSNTAWRLFVRSTPPQPPRWVSALNDITAQPHQQSVLSSASSAVLLVKRGPRTYAVTFGGGFHAVDQAKIQRGFGLRVTANTIAADRVVSADTKRLQRSGASQKVILPSASALYELGIEPTEEWVRQLSGKSADTTFATIAAGSDSLRLNIDRFTLHDLPSKLDAVAAKYDATAYKTDFGFLDDLRMVPAKDPIVATLNNTVTQQLLTHSGDLSFAAPDPFEQLDVEFFRFKYRKERFTESLSPDAVYDALGQLNLGVDPLHGVRVSAFGGDGNEVDKSYPLFDYVQAEVTTSGRRYVLTSGVWFEVAADFVADVNDFVAAIPDISGQLNLPTWEETRWKDVSNDTGEGAYNSHVAATMGLVLMDKKNVTIVGRQRVEVCDLMTKDRVLICVKRASRSSSLSHLFAQGSVSASLMFEPAYSQHVLTQLKTVDPAVTVMGAPSEWTFVYAIATAKPGALADSMFFFSQVHLRTHVKQIRERGFNVALCRIELV